MTILAGTCGLNTFTEEILNIIFYAVQEKVEEQSIASVNIKNVTG